MFRCPHCGQAQEMPVKDDGQQFLINTDTKRAGFALDFCFLAEKDQEHDQWQHVTDEMVPAIEEQLIAQHRTLTKCPRCEEERETKLWFKCWDDPLQSDELESENLCHCGTELWLDRVRNVTPPTYAFVCDKEGCGWIKPRNTVSGAQ